ncbi:MAG: translation initiation factor IF-3 [Planctomycetaceae bacterium]
MFSLRSPLLLSSIPTEVKINRLQPATQQRQDQPRMNERIRLSPVKVVGEDGEMLGEMETAAALQLARDAGLDLVEVAPDVRPPICRIMDYGKMQFQRQKRSGGAKAHRTQLKTIRLRAKTGQHDIDVKIGRARRFLLRGDKVKFVVIFRGRENAHHDRGRDMLNDILKTIDEMIVIEQTPRMESGRMMSAIVKPRPGLKGTIKDWDPNAADDTLDESVDEPIELHVGVDD